MFKCWFKKWKYIVVL